MFANEESLTCCFDEVLLRDKSPFSPKYIAREFDYREGRTDVILANEYGDLLAFEMKLEKWKQALNQAYRNSSFAHYSYIVLPSQAAKRAVKQENEFIKRGVGLCVVDGATIRIEIKAKRIEPLRPWLTESAFEYMFERNYTDHAII